MKDNFTPEQEAQFPEAAFNGKTSAEISGILADLGDDEFRARAFRKINMLPISQRTEVIDYLCENSVKYHFTEIIVPEKIGNEIVTAIGEYAFSPDAKRIREEQREIRRNITKISLPDTVKSIGEFAFFKCKALAEVNIPAGLVEISRGMLDCTALEEIVIGGSVRKIGAVAFYGCRGLKTVKVCEGIEEIDSAAFYNCSALETVELPRSLITIADSDKSDYPFRGCRNITVTVHKGSYAESCCERKRINYKYIGG